MLNCFQSGVQMKVLYFIMTVFSPAFRWRYFTSLWLCSVRRSDEGILLHYDCVQSGVQMKVLDFIMTVFSPEFRWRYLTSLWLCSVRRSDEGTWLHYDCVQSGVQMKVLYFIMTVFSPAFRWRYFTSLWLQRYLSSSVNVPHDSVSIQDLFGIHQSLVLLLGTSLSLRC